MAKIIKLRYGLILVLILTLPLGFCTSKNEKAKQQKIPDEQIESERKEAIVKRQIAVNDSLSSALLNRFPSATNLDSVKYLSYTYIFQKFLEKSAGFLYIKEAFLIDVEKYNERYSISVHWYIPTIRGKFFVNQLLSIRLLQEMKQTYTMKKCCLVVKVNELIPFKLGQDKPFYQLNGELTDYYFLIQ